MVALPRFDLRDTKIKRNNYYLSIAMVESGKIFISANLDHGRVIEGLKSPV